MAATAGVRGSRAHSARRCLAGQVGPGLCTLRLATRLRADRSDRPGARARARRAQWPGTWRRASAQPDHHDGAHGRTIMMARMARGRCAHHASLGDKSRVLA